MEKGRVENSIGLHPKELPQRFRNHAREALNAQARRNQFDERRS